MRRLFGVCTLVLAVGCASGPGDFAKNEPTEDVMTQVAANDHSFEPESDIRQVSNDSPAGFTTTSSGLKYRIVKDGKGRRPHANSTVTCHYRGWLDNGKEFDSSYGKSAATFPLNGVIKGWTEGLQLIQEGGKIELEIPSELGYGRRGSPPTIPANSTLHFEIELFKVR